MAAFTKAICTFFSDRIASQWLEMEECNTSSRVLQMLPCCNRDPSYTLLRLQPPGVNKKGQICMNINMKWSLLKDYPLKEIFKRTSWLTFKMLMIIQIVRLACATMFGNILYTINSHTG